MHLITFTLERMFNVTPSDPDDEVSVTFSIAFDGQEHHKVKLLGKAALTCGALMTAILERKDDWTTLLALRDHATGINHMNNVYDWTAPLVLVLVMLALPVALFATLLEGESVLWPMLSWFGFAACGWFIAAVRSASLEAEIVMRLHPRPALPPEPWQTFRK